MLVPVESSRAALADEATAASAWSVRHSWTLEVDLDGLRVRATTRHPVDGDDLYLSGIFDDYKALPPIWLFTTVDGDASTGAAWPAGGTVAASSSIFHSIGVICAHFSRRAYREDKGPHANDWGPSIRWLDVQEGVHAITLADMLSVFDLHLGASPGRMA